MRSIDNWSVSILPSEQCVTVSTELFTGCPLLASKYSIMDIVIASLPFTDTVKPLLAPALLKAQVVRAGFTARACDLNAEQRQRMLTHPDRNLIIEFYKTGRLDPRVAEEIESEIHFMVDRILIDQPDTVALSLLTYDCRWAARWVAWEIRRRSPQTAILLGGAGLLINGYGDTLLGDELHQAGICDAWIRGDGDVTLPGWLQGRRVAPGIMTADWRQHTNAELATFAAPDYTDYRWDLYDPDTPIAIYGSRGCVRDCSFCDIKAHWPRYTWRTGDSIFEEMLAMHRQYGRSRFHFQDSLINGNMREYRQLCRRLAEHNHQHPEQRLTWQSFFIMRPSSQFSEDDWRLTHESGAEHLMIGVESLHEPSRYHLGKQFSNQDLEYGLSQISKWNQVHPMKCSLLMIIGYILETDQDQRAIKQWFRDHAHYRDIAQIVFSPGLGILANTPLSRNFDKLGLRWVGPDNTDWANNNSDPPLRARWYKDLYQLVNRELGFRAPIGHDNHYILERMERGKFFEDKNRL